jgi:purine-cytosine permease-like protein
MVPLNWYGFAENDLLQRITWPLFLIGFGFLLWRTFSLPSHIAFNAKAASVQSFAQALAAVLPVFTIQALLVGDWSRFMRKRDISRASWIAALVTIGGLFLVEAPLGALMALYTRDANPGVYAAKLLGVGGVLWILVTQIRINNMNFYSASLALANFASRVLHWVPGRHVWVVITGLITVATTEAGILGHLLQVLSFLGVFLMAWLGTLLADILVTRPILKIGPQDIEHRRGYLVNWGYPAVVSLIVACVIGAILLLGNVPDATYGAFWGELLAFVIGAGGYIVLSWALRNNWSLIARAPNEGWVDKPSLPDERLEAAANFLVCGICGRSYMKQDMLTCPVTGNNVICSVCCAAHGTCHDVCKATPIFVISEVAVMGKQGQTAAGPVAIP